MKRLLLLITIILGMAAMFGLYTYMDDQTVGSCTTRQADLIIKNAKIFTSDQNNPQAIALVVKDSRANGKTLF